MSTLLIELSFSFHGMGISHVGNALYRLVLL